MKRSNRAGGRAGRFFYKFSLTLFDKGFIELFGPYGVYLKLKEIINNISKLETQFIYHYCGSFLIGIIFFLLFLNQAVYYPIPYYDPFS